MQYISVTPNLGLYYPGIDYLRQKIGKAMLASNFQVPVVIYCAKISGLDYTAAKVKFHEWMFDFFCLNQFFFIGYYEYCS
jgi:hypothetical protein